MRDVFIFEKECDSMKEAEKYAEYCQRNYQGGFIAKRVLETSFCEMLDCIDKPEFMTQVGSALR
jgi:hypothetical protein